jgi:hypothetical protein
MLLKKFSVKKNKSLIYMNRYILIFFLAGIYFVGYSQNNNLESNFINPPESTKPWVYWYWLNDNISKEGITKDLEAMAKAGIGEALIGNVVDILNPKLGNVKVLSDEWWSCLEHAIKEGDRLGVKTGMFNCPGWSQSGGPWVKPEQAMRYLNTTEYRVHGGKQIVLKLEKPGINFQQVGVQAYPAPAYDNNAITLNDIKSISSTIVNDDAKKLFDGIKQQPVIIPKGETTIDIMLKNDFTLRSAILFPLISTMTSECCIYSKSEKDEWIQISKIVIDRGNLKVHIGPIRFGALAGTFPAVTTRNIRLVFKSSTEGQLCEVELTGAARISNFVEKQLGKMCPRPTISATYYLWGKSNNVSDKKLVVNPDHVIDVSQYVNSNNELVWQAPKGEWIIQYTGMMPTGAKNNPTTPEGRGYEIDKMSKNAAFSHFDSYVGKILKQIPYEQRKGFRHVVADSYEMGSQNWTDDMHVFFKNTYNYDPMPWLPVLTGRVVKSSELSERFLWDLRRLVADKIATEYVGGLREKCEQNGLRLWLENYGHWGFPGEFLKYGGASHDLGGEFWLSNPDLGLVECRSASSAAHIYGKKVVSAEAFTSRWTFNVQPRDFKIRGDWAWTQGINHFVLHVYIHQPNENKPGINAWFGTDFNRHNTWFDYSKSYFDYIRRSSAMLQYGNHTADVAYFISEDVPNMTGEMEPKLPSGYDYDFINAEVMFNAYVENGRISLPGGASYRLLVLPHRETMRPELLAKIGELVRNGANVLGNAPLFSPSMENYPTSDNRVKTLSNELWKKQGGKYLNENKVGKGKVFCGLSIEAVFEKLNEKPRIILPENMLYAQRSDGHTQLFFLTNQTNYKINSEVSFRVSGLQPELWDAVTGEIRLLPDFKQKNGYTIIPLEFGGGDSYFIVFRNKITEQQSVKRNFNTFETVLTIPDKWTLSFDTTFRAPKVLETDSLFDFTTHENANIKYYSGKTVYTTEFNYDGDCGLPFAIDLGKVDGLASIKLNGQKLEILWRYPYRSNVSGWIKNGKNIMEIELINCWWNRLVGDQQPGEIPVTSTAYVDWKSDSPLLPSGISGPVRLKRIINK